MEFDSAREVNWYLSIYQFPMCNGPDSSSSEFCSSFTSTFHLLLVHKPANQIQPLPLSNTKTTQPLFQSLSTYLLLSASPSNIYWPFNSPMAMWLPEVLCQSHQISSDCLYFIYSVVLTWGTRAWSAVLLRCLAIKSKVSTFLFK